MLNVGQHCRQLPFCLDCVGILGQEGTLGLAVSVGTACYGGH